MYARGPLWTLQLAAVLAIASATSALPNLVFERAGTCAANYTQCTQAGLPANFCCSTGSTCNLLAGGTTVLCCPEGSSCTTIQTISCTLSLQNPATNPKAAVKTTVLSGKLPTCGNGCCPWGYHCDGNSGDCVMDADQSKKPNAASTPAAPSSAHPTSTASNGATSTSSTAAGTTSTADASASTEPPASTTARKTLNTAAIVGGVVGGLLGLSLITACVCVQRHRRKKAAAAREKRDSSQSFGNIISGDIISAPMPHADYHTQRLDFLAKVPNPSVSSSPTTPTQPHTHTPTQPQPQPQHGGHFLPPGSPYSASLGFPSHSRPTTPVEGEGTPRSHHNSAEVGGLRNLTDRYSGGGGGGGGPGFLPAPFTPRGEHFHSGGSESINIFADPSTVGSPSIYNRRDTTWTEFQAHADRNGLDSPMPTPGRRGDGGGGGGGGEGTGGRRL
ncbi:hypothetical protein F4825DRAFT_6305 [Nemania diffusa]|nr:hypothetical protein F4825DRAFT_6305 [Nemania diffusa]